MGEVRAAPGAGGVGGGSECAYARGCARELMRAHTTVLRYSLFRPLDPVLAADLQDSLRYLPVSPIGLISLVDVSTELSADVVVNHTGKKNGAECRGGRRG